MRRALFASGLVFALWGCSGVDLDSTNWRCENKDECGAGYVCNQVTGACEAALNGVDGVYEDKIIFGASASIEGGPTTDTCQPFIQGLRAGADAVNRRGGVHGREIELLVRNDDYDASIAEANATYFTEGKSRRAFALVGFNGSPTSIAAMNVALEAKTIFFGAVSGSDTLRDNQRYVFNYRPSYVQEVEAAVRYVTKYRPTKIHPRNVAVYAQATGSKTTDPNYHDLCTWEATGDGGVTETCDDSTKQIAGLDPFGRPGFDGVLSALSQDYGYEAKQIIFASFEKGTDEEEQDESKQVDAPVEHLLRWLGRPKTADEVGEDGTFEAAIVLQATNAPAAAFANKLLSAVDEIQASQAGADESITLSTVKIDGEGVVLSADEKNQIKKLAKLDFAGVILGPAFGEDIQKSAVDGRCTDSNFYSLQVVPHPESQVTAAINFREAAVASGEEVLQDNFNAFEGYIVMQLLAKALQENGRDITTEMLVDSLENKMDDIDLGLGVPLSFSGSNHQASKVAWFTKMNGSCSFEDYSVPDELLNPSE